MATNNYVKLDAGFFLNPKITPLQHAAVAAYLCSLCCAKLANQDGEFQVRQILALADVTRDDVQPLYDYGFWEQSSVKDVAVVHDFLDWNLSRSEQEKRAESARKNGAFGGRSTKKPTSVTDTLNPDRKPTGLTETLNQDGKPTGLTDTETVKERKKEINKERKKEMPPLPPPEGGKPPKTKKTSFPKNFQLTPGQQTYAQEAGIDINIALQLFEDWAIAGGKTYADWNRAFSNALRDWLPEKVRRAQTNRTRQNAQTNPATTRMQNTFAAIDATKNPYTPVPF